jgi:hypothetical protein
LLADRASMNSLRNQEGSKKNILLVELMVLLLGLALAIGFLVADIQAQIAPAAAPAQQEGTQQPAAPSATVPPASVIRLAIAACSSS